MFESISQNVIQSAQLLAQEQGFAICISVVDDAGLLRGFLRMDDAVPGAIDVSLKKARMAALFRTDSRDIGAAAQPGGAIYTLEATNGGLISFGGGIVLKDNEGKVIGAVGVAGATVEADQEIALKSAGRP
ncbi:GlcG/HbpS family heme-binding protein [Klebsiella michiganensis]|uniref:GlcG/HbpS family heme-binding protein n=1 Tax=Klebsiella TaxID=570 RepID=UPI001F154E7C|nr:heme-binding protein [Klebsiella grimontii]